MNKQAFSVFVKKKPTLMETEKGDPVGTEFILHGIPIPYVLPFHVMLCSDNFC